MSTECIEIVLDDIGKGLKLTIYPEDNSKIRMIDSNEAKEFCESLYQLYEGHSYEYCFEGEEGYQLYSTTKGIVFYSKSKRNSGRIVPNTYVGRLNLEIKKGDKTEKVIDFEVLATKFNKDIDKSYRDNYRFMLENITDKCTELLMQINTPIHQNFEVDYNSDSSTVYQRFCFVQSMINNKIFKESIEQIINNPKTNLEIVSDTSDIRRIKRIDNKTIHQIISSQNRIKLSNQDNLKNYGFNSIPSRIEIERKIENIDTAENRFVKHVLSVFSDFCEKCMKIFQKNDMKNPESEAQFIINKISNYLNHPFFKQINPPNIIKLNSPVLQKRSGYREILNRWLQFDLALKLIWQGGDEVYKAGKKDIATLYEYWTFFTLYDLVRDKFNIEKVSYDGKNYKNLFETTKDGLNLMLKSGKHTALEGDFNKRNRDLKIKFSYNRTFTGDNEYKDKKSGSWTLALRPDYTLSIWPKALEEEVAEEKESIVHIHFDAKYKIDNFYETKSSINNEQEIENELNEIKNDERKGIYKNADLLKMHAYKDAIRRTGGAYILYPGKIDKQFRGFHEIIPGLGAFSINPSYVYTDVKELSEFIDLIIDHLLDLTSQREKLYDSTYNIFKREKRDEDVLHERIAEYSDKQKINPDEIYVIIGYYQKKQYKWIIKNKLYNLRTGTRKGSLSLTDEYLKAKYLLLHGRNNKLEIFIIDPQGPKIYSREDIEETGYEKPSGDLYLVYSLLENSCNEFEIDGIDINKIPNNNSSDKKPKIITLTQLLKTKH